MIDALLVTLAAVSLLAGLLAVLCLPLSGSKRCLLALAWSGWSLADSRRWWRAARCLRALRFGAVGGWRGLDRNGIWQPLEEAPGTLVTRRFLWLCFRLPDGRLALLALTRHSLPAAAWRRLQAALRIAGAAG